MYKINAARSSHVHWKWAYLCEHLLGFFFIVWGRGARFIKTAGSRCHSHGFPLLKQHYSVHLSSLCIWHVQITDTFTHMQVIKAVILHGLLQTPTLMHMYRNTHSGFCFHPKQPVMDRTFPFWTGRKHMPPGTLVCESTLKCPHLILLYDKWDESCSFSLWGKAPLAQQGER